MTFDCNLVLCHINEIVLALTKKRQTKNDVNFDNSETEHGCRGNKFLVLAI
jgi:hypothetical protein